MRWAVTVKLFGGDFNMVEEKSFIQSPIFKLLSICRVLPYGVKFIRLTLHPKGRLFCIRKALQYSLLLFLRRQIFLHGAHIFQSFSPHVCALFLPLLFFLVDSSEIVLFLTEQKIYWFPRAQVVLGYVTYKQKIKRGIKDVKYIIFQTDIRGWFCSDSACRILIKSKAIQNVHTNVHPVGINIAGI